MGGSLSCTKTQAMEKETLTTKVGTDSTVITMEREYSTSAFTTEGAIAEPKSNSCLETISFCFLTKVRIVPFFKVKK